MIQRVLLVVFGKLINSQRVAVFAHFVEASICHVNTISVLRGARVKSRSCSRIRDPAETHNKIQLAASAGRPAMCTTLTMVRA